MKLYYKDDSITLYNDNMLNLLDDIPLNSIDAVVTDPPYELGFMGKSWDASGIAFRPETWRHCWDVLKPGGYLLAFGGSRTFHRIACAIEDAGFEIRDTIMWLYGCLSEDTEVLTKRGFKKFDEIKQEDEIRIYDIENGIYKWEKPQRWNVYSVNKDTCYRIKSDNTDQLVSRNHRCLVERDGNLVFEFAENLSNMERVPVLSYDIPYIQKGQQCVLLTDLLWQDERLAYKLCEQWQGQEEPKEITLGRNEPILERWGNLSQQERELFCSENKKCEVSPRVYDNGEKRWICDGTQANCGSSDWATTVENRGSSSYQPQCRGQQAGESDVVCNEQRPQEVRGWTTYTTSLATITTEKYTGIIFCPTVSTGCFVARRNGKVFLTGNSGFPKSMNIGLAIDRKSGVESEIIGIKEHCKKDFKENNLYAKADANKNNTKCFGYGTEIIKSAQNEWSGWGTALKPAYEPIIVARKPCDGSCVDNVIKWGVGGINIDECRVGTDYIGGGTMPDLRDVGRKSKELIGIDKLSFGQVADAERKEYEGHFGRFPANTILTYDDSDYDEVCGGFPQSKGASSQNNYSNGHIYRGQSLQESSTSLEGYREWYNDEGSAARYFYCAKASKRDRDEGCEALPNTVNACSNQAIAELKRGNDEFSDENNSTFNKVYKGKNTHPTVKPTSLMQYLVRLVAPKGATILDPFMGSGSTGKATMYENMDRDANYKFVGIELTDEYLPIAKARIDYVVNHGIVLDRGEDETADEVSSEPKSKFERFTWDI